MFVVYAGEGQLKRGVPAALPLMASFSSADHPGEMHYTSRSRTHNHIIIFIAFLITVHSHDSLLVMLHFVVYVDLGCYFYLFFVSYFRRFYCIDIVLIM